MTAKKQEKVLKMYNFELTGLSDDALLAELGVKGFESEAEAVEEGDAAMNAVDHFCVYEITIKKIATYGPSKRERKPA